MLLVEDWMTKDPIMLLEDQTLAEAILVLSGSSLHALPVVNTSGRLAGIISKDEIINSLINHTVPEIKIRTIMKVSPLSVSAASYIEEIEDDFSHGFIPVIDKEQKLSGILTSEDKIKALTKKMHEIKEKFEEANHMLETLKIVLDTAYEGVVVIDSKGIIRDFNKAYSQFIGVTREEAIGKHVTEIIENTNLHVTVETGIPERGYIQNIMGQDMIVHRIPIWRDGKVVGAIGMLIFQGVSEIYHILNRIQDLSRNVDTKGRLPVSEPSSRVSEFTFDGIVGRSPEILRIKRLASKASRVPSTVLITGESGTGKEVFSKSIHGASLYNKGNFVSVNCAAIPEHLLEAELFGYEEGSFTGAKKGGKIGKVELAHQGTLFLDEIGDMPLYMQAKILRVLEERVVERVGGLKKTEVDVRIIAATNKNLEEMVKKGQFREDLFFRLNIIRIHIPSLRERKSDIPYLTSYHMERICRKFQIEKKEFAKEAMDAFMDYSWPGNIRELVNTLEMLMGLVDGPIIKRGHLPEVFLGYKERQPEMTENPENRSGEKESNRQSNWRDVVAHEERTAIQRALIEERGNKAAVARKLGIHRSTLYEKMKKYELV
ncbi:sigma-54-dependent Fis family transcriptional regulator [Priestia abyssalis]|uniref:sigma-54-dependent Fis family transcriptional regulator n=1 Tax=Priestia abyssalis TaxID=1221450 RepID=UPI001473EA95|nr:sigma-54-dependent Fis family transcriptional regulator [Priestia abyssalis]